MIARILIRWIIIVIALFAAEWLVDGIYVTGTEGWIAFSVMAIVLGLVNAVIRPILSCLACGCIALTLGLFLLVINGLTLWFSSWIAVNVLNVGFVVEDYLSAFLGALIVSAVSFVLSLLLVDD